MAGRCENEENISRKRIGERIDQMPADALNSKAIELRTTPKGFIPNVRIALCLSFAGLIVGSMVKSLFFDCFTVRCAIGEVKRRTTVIANQPSGNNISHVSD